MLLKMKWDNTGGFRSEKESDLTYGAYWFPRATKLVGVKQRKFIL